MEVLHFLRVSSVPVVGWGEVGGTGEGVEKEGRGSRLLVGVSYILVIGKCLAKDADARRDIELL